MNRQQVMVHTQFPANTRRMGGLVGALGSQAVIDGGCFYTPGICGVGEQQQGKAVGPARKAYAKFALAIVPADRLKVRPEPFDQFGRDGHISRKLPCCAQRHNCR